MGILDKILNRKPASTEKPDFSAPGFRTITEYNPVFTSFNGKVYEQELTRSAIERIAQACSKLKPEVIGDQDSPIAKTIKTRPNSMMTWPKFLARLATIYEVDDTAFVVPTFKRDMKTIDGFFPFKCESAELCEYKGEPWLIFYTATGENMAIELKYVCILTKFQYESDVFGSPNVLDSTMGLIDAQTKAQQAAIKNGAKIRFIGSLTGMVQEKDMEDKRKRFVESNFNAENTGGLLLYDSTFGKVEPIDQKSYVIDNDEMERIENNIYNYFGINEHILQNNYTEEQWGAFYEGCIEPFAIMLGEGLTQVCYSMTEQVHGKRIEFSTNRLQYASMASKRNMVRDMVDRGLMTLNEGREVLQLPPLPDGDIRVIRGEYINLSNLDMQFGKKAKQHNEEGDKDFDLGGDDDIYNDSDGHDKGDF